MIIVIQYNNGDKSSISTNLSKKDAQTLAKRIAKKTDDVKQVSVDNFVVTKVRFNLPNKFTIKNLLRERNSILSRKGIKNVI